MGKVGGLSSAQFKAFIDHIEPLEKEKTAIREQIREVFGEAKGTGFDIRIIRQILKIRKMETQERLEQEELLVLYLIVLGMNESPSTLDILKAAYYFSYRNSWAALTKHAN